MLAILFSFCVAFGQDIISTVAGTGVAQSTGDGGPAIVADVFWPHQVDVDPAGNVYMVSPMSHRVRMVNALTGVITTVAGNGTAGYGGDYGPATGARLSGPKGIAIDPTGNYLYIADTLNYLVRRVELSSGIITTYAGIPNSPPAFPGQGDGAWATVAPIGTPSGLAVDTNGDLYIAAQSSNRIRKVAAATGIITTVAGTGNGGWGGDGGLALLALLEQPTDVEIDDDGNLYISDLNNFRIRKVTAATGIIETFAGTGVPDPNGIAYPYQLSWSAASGFLYVADQYNNRIWRLDDAGGIHPAAGDGNYPVGNPGDGLPATLAQLYSPVGVVVDPLGCLYIGDTFDSRIRHVCLDVEGGDGDGDGDGVPDGSDLCPGFDDTLDADTDTIPDGCDVCAGSDDLLDGDGDTVPDGCDVCEGSDDALDSDVDGVPNGCDRCPGADDGLDADTDGTPDD